MPTAYWSVINAGVKRGDTVIVLGCGPVGLMAQNSLGCKVLNSNRSRLLRLSNTLCKKINNVEVFEFTKFPDMGEHLKEITHGSADVVIDCVGMDGKKSP